MLNRPRVARICGEPGLAGVSHRRRVSPVQVARRSVSQARSAPSDLRARRGGNAGHMPSSAHNEWRSAAMVDVWGLTWVAARKGNEPWKQFQPMDLVRGGARGKPFWHAEAQAGPLWMQPQVIGRPREDGRHPDAEDVRIWNLISCAGGARGILYPRWRPLLDGPLFGAFGAFAMDGSVTPRAEMAGKVAKWANAHADVWKSNPVKGDVGLVFVPESELFNYVQQGETAFYAQSISGAYQAFFDQNIQADFVAFDNIDEYKIIYLPYPVMLKRETADRLKEYVQDGGTLISEGLPAYFGDHGHVGTVQPNYGLDELFGAREKYVEFVPDLSEQLMFEVKGSKIYGRYFRQDYDLQGGNAAGQYPMATPPPSRTVRQGADVADRLLSRCGLLPAPWRGDQGVVCRLPEAGGTDPADCDRRSCFAGAAASGSGRYPHLGDKPYAGGEASDRHPGRIRR